MHLRWQPSPGLLLCIVLGACGPLDTTRRHPGVDWLHTAVLQSQPIDAFVPWHRQSRGGRSGGGRLLHSRLPGGHAGTQGPVSLCCDMGFQEAPLEEALMPNPARAAPGTPPQVGLPALTPLVV